MLLTPGAGIAKAANGPTHPAPIHFPPAPSTQAPMFDIIPHVQISIVTGGYLLSLAHPYAINPHTGEIEYLYSTHVHTSLAHVLELAARHIVDLQETPTQEVEVEMNKNKKTKKPQKPDKSQPQSKPQKCKQPKKK